MKLEQALKRIEELERRVKELEARPLVATGGPQYHYHYHPALPMPAPQPLPVYPWNPMTPYCGGVGSQTLG